MKSLKLSDLYEFLVALLFVGAIIGGLTFWAQSAIKPPLKFSAESAIELLPIDATIEYRYGRKSNKRRTLP